jgi:WD40 repeat protein
MLWDPAMGEHVQELEGHSGPVNAIAISSNSQLLASASDDKTVRLWNPATGEQVQELKAHSSSVRAIVFPPMGNYSHQHQTIKPLGSGI